MGSLVVQLVKNLPAVQETWVGSLGQEDPLEKGMATHSSIIAWKVLLTEEPGGPQSMGSQELDTTQLLNHQGVRNTLAGKFFTSSVTWEALFFFKMRHRFNLWDRKIPWRRKWHPLQLFLPGESHGQRSLAIVYGIVKSGTQLSRHAHVFSIQNAQTTLSLNNRKYNSPKNAQFHGLKYRVHKQIHIHQNQ